MAEDFTNERRHTADECQAIPDVRYEIDRLDQILVRLIAERQTYMDAAARIKPSRDKVRDEDRIEDVLTKVLAAAEREGLDRSIAEPVWREMIDRCIAYEFEVWDDLRKAAKA